MTWKNEKQRHAMARKGIKTIEKFPDSILVNHFKPHTGLPIHMDMMENPEYFRKNKGIAWKIIWMTPEDYEIAIRHGFMMTDRHDSGQYEKYTIREMRISSEHLKKIIGIMKEKSVPMPYLQYDIFQSRFDSDKEIKNFNQEGHHRVVAAEKLGIQKIPVFIEFPSDKEQFEKIRGIMSLQILVQTKNEVD